MNKIEIEYELKMLESSLEMYKKTQCELNGDDTKTEQYNIIANEIEKLECEIANAKARLNMQTTDSQHPFLQPTEGYEMLRDCDFVVRMPKESGIKPFMIKECSYVEMINNYTLYLSIQEYHSKDFNLPLALQKLQKISGFKVVVDRINSKGEVLYSTVFSGCSMSKPTFPKFMYSGENQYHKYYGVVIPYSSAKVFDNELKRDVSDFID